MNIRHKLPLFALIHLLAAMTFSDTQVQGEQISTRLDLPAITLTPNDLVEVGLTGFGRFGNGEFRTFDDYVARRAEFLNKPEETIRAAFQDAGWQRGYVTNLGLPAEPGNPQSPASQVAFSVVYEYTDMEGAAAAYDFNQDYADVTVGTIAVVPGIRPFADASYMTHLEWIDPADGRPSRQIDLTLRRGNIVASTGLIQFIEEEDLATPATVPAGVITHVEAMADRLLERIERAASGNSPGMSHVIYRLNESEFPIAFSTEGYRRLVGEDPPYYNGYQDDFPGDSDAFAKVVTAYELNQGLLQPGDPYYVVRLIRFETADQAQTYLVRIREDGMSPADTPAEEVDGAQPFGDDSWTIAYSAEFEPGHPIAGFAVHARVDTTVMMLLLEGAVQPDLATVESIAAAQVDCLGTESCLQGLTLPSPPIATPASSLSWR